MKRCSAHWVALVLVIIGGLNWGLVGFFNWNLVEVIFSSVPVVVRIIYAVVGLAAVFALFESKCCMKKPA